MSWRTFQRKGSKSEFAFPTVTIHGDGTIALNGPAIAALAGDGALDPAQAVSPPALELLYDDETPNQVGFRLHKDGPYRPRRRKAERSWVLSGSSFLRFVAYTPRETTRFRATLRPDRILAIDLRTPLGAARGSTAPG